MQKVSISAIIPTYNREDTVGAAIGSVLSQTRSVDEVIVVDDGSTDGTRDVVENIDSPKVRYIFQKNGGGAAALNIGIRSAVCEWIALLDSDDTWHAAKIEKQIELISSDPTIEFVHTNRRLCWESGGTDDGRLEVGLTEGTDKGFLFKHWSTKTSTVLFRKKLLERADYPFREDLRICYDYELFWRLILLSERIGYVMEPVVDILMSGDGLSRIDDMVKRYRENIAAMNSIINWISVHYPNDRKYRNIMGKRLAGEFRSLAASRFHTPQKNKIFEDIYFMISNTGNRNLMRIIQQQLGKMNTSILKRHIWPYLS